MIVPDLDLLIFAHNEGSEFHHDASAWWTALVNGAEPIGMPSQISNGFIRLMSNPRVMNPPLMPAEATRVVAEWLVNDHIVTLNPGLRYLEILERILIETGATTGLVPDATIAALAIENGAEVHTNNDRDFQRFPDLLWRNPLR